MAAPLRPACKKELKQSHRETCGGFGLNQTCSARIPLSLVLLLCHTLLTSCSWWQPWSHAEGYDLLPRPHWTSPGHDGPPKVTVHFVSPVLACGTVCRHQRRMHLHCLYLAGCSNTKLSVIVTSPTCANLSLTDVLFPHNRLVNLLTLYSVLALL